jgi:hypothetical protein
MVVDHKGSMQKDPEKVVCLYSMEVGRMQRMQSVDTLKTVWVAPEPK